MNGYVKDVNLKDMNVKDVNSSTSDEPFWQLGGGGYIVSIDSITVSSPETFFLFLSYVCYRVHMNKLNIKIVSFVDDPAL